MVYCITIEGEVRFESNRNLNHSAGDIVRTIIYDNQRALITILIPRMSLIQDGIDPVIDVPSVNLSEVNLADGSAPGWFCDEFNTNHYLLHCGR
ncbi:hypothetical protein OH492_09190 [Vibrio chagasii]|nr:hypothetical protein [Vibrio chagasii]